MLFSRIDESLTALRIAIEITAAGIEEAKVSPTRRPRYTFAAVKTNVRSAPRIRPRIVSSFGLIGQMLHPARDSWRVVRGTPLSASPAKPPPDERQHERRHDQDGEYRGVIDVDRVADEEIGVAVCLCEAVPLGPDAHHRARQQGCAERHPVNHAEQGDSGPSPVTKSHSVLPVEGDSRREPGARHSEAGPNLHRPVRAGNTLAVPFRARGTIRGPFAPLHVKHRTPTTKS